MAILAPPRGYEDFTDFDHVSIKDFYRRFKMMYWNSRLWKGKLSYRPYSEDSVYNIKSPEFNIILKAFVEKLLVEMLYQGRDFHLPYNSGFIRFVRRKNYVFKAKFVNGKKVITTDYKGNPVIHSLVNPWASKEAKKNIYYTNEHTNGDYFTLRYYAPNSVYKRPNFRCLVFKKNDQAKKLIGATILADPSKINVYKAT